MMDLVRVIPAKAGIQHETKDAALRRNFAGVWAPAYAGVTIQ
jgi:hypothetical protein